MQYLVSPGPLSASVLCSRSAALLCRRREIGSAACGTSDTVRGSSVSGRALLFAAAAPRTPPIDPRCATRRLSVRHSSSPPRQISHSPPAQPASSRAEARSQARSSHGTALLTLVDLAARYRPVSSCEYVGEGREGEVLRCCPLYACGISVLTNQAA